VTQERSSSACAPLRRRFKSPVHGQCPPGFYRDREHHGTTDDDDQGQPRCRDGRRQRQRPGRGRVCRRCTTCVPGVGAVRPCGRRSDTVCQACVASVSYSDLASHEQPCLPCTRCSQYSVIQRNCTVTHDAVCHRCRKGFFLFFLYARLWIQVVKTRM